MKDCYYIYLVKDSHGNKAFDVVECEGDTIFIPNMRDNEGTHLPFENEPHHLEEWAKGNGIEVKEIKKQIDFDEEWNSIE